VFSSLFVGLAAPSAGASASAKTATGGLDFNAYCARKRSGVGWRSYAVLLNRRDAKSWRCATGVLFKGRDPINVRDACKMRYGNRAVEVLGNRSNPYSWYCRY
jgi:hypothetical protein